MSTKTTNLEMTLLAEEDNFDTNVYNENFQKTDDKIGELNSMLGSEELTTTSQTHSGAINELNKKIVTTVYCGSTLVTTVANGTASVNVTYENPFAENIKPKILANVVTSLPNLHSLSISNISNTGFTINLYREGSSADMWVEWIVATNLDS